MPLHVKYFESRTGEIALPPSDEGAEQVRQHPKFKDWELKEANTLGEVDALQQRMYRQVVEEMERDRVHEEIVWKDKMSTVRSNLITRMQSSATSAYEKDFIKAYLECSDQRKRDNAKKRFTCDQAFFEAREMDRARTPEEVLGESL